MSSYKIGYGKPPKATQFQKGKSGNPRGRPKGSLNLATDLASELREIITVSEHGRPRRVSKQRALIKSLLAKALQGDIRAATAVLALARVTSRHRTSRMKASMPRNSQSYAALHHGCSNPWDRSNGFEQRSRTREDSGAQSTRRTLPPTFRRIRICRFPGGESWQSAYCQLAYRCD
jgi:hypothetical protein